MKKLLFGFLMATLLVSPLSAQTPKGMPLGTMGSIALTSQKSADWSYGFEYFKETRAGHGVGLYGWYQDGPSDNFYTFGADHVIGLHGEKVMVAFQYGLRGNLVGDRWTAASMPLTLVASVPFAFAGLDVAPFLETGAALSFANKDFTGSGDYEWSRMRVGEMGIAFARGSAGLSFAIDANNADVYRIKAAWALDR